LDLDGTVIVTKSGEIFAKDKDDWKFNENIISRIEKYVDDGYYVMIVSNQGGIETGVVKLNDFRIKIRKVVNEIIINTGCPMSRIGYRFSMSNSPEDYYRKPNPGMAYDLAMAYILNLSECLMVGDASGMIRKQVDVYKDISSPTGWSHKSGEHLTDKEQKSITFFGTSTGTLTIRDFSDSDFRFAMNTGMFYSDISDFFLGVPALKNVPFYNKSHNI
jgi:DNA 3'-phosphatase